MPPGPPPPGTAFWTINAGHLSGGPDRIKLVGCHIIRNADNFTFTQPDWTPLKTSSGPPRPSAAFSFPTFDYNGIYTWTIRMAAPPAMSNVPWGVDSWSFPPQPLVGREDTGSGQSGEFTAQAGSGLGQGEETASSAKA
jgi:hypothetical protein